MTPAVSCWQRAATAAGTVGGAEQHGMSEAEPHSTLLNYTEPHGKSSRLQMLASCRVVPSAIAIIALIFSDASRAADAPDKATAPVPVEELRKGLTSALGDSFEYLGGEIGWTKARIGSWGAERFWFARVRARKPGEFALSYSIRFEFPADTRQNWLKPDRAVYTIPIKIGDRGAARVVLPGSTWAGSRSSLSASTTPRS